MAKTPDELRDLLSGGHNVWVATVAPDGMPNVSIKGSGALLDDEHLYFADMFSHKTRENLENSTAGSPWASTTPSASWRCR